MALITFSRSVVICVVAIAIVLQQILSLSPYPTYRENTPPPSLSPYPIYLENPPPSSLSPAPSNGILQNVIRVGEGVLQQPEDVAVDENGVLYTVTRDGSVFRMPRNGTWERWLQINSTTALGITTTPAGDLIVCDANQGLLNVSEDGVTVLTSYVDGSRIRLADDVIATLDGTLYFTDATTEYNYSTWQLDLLEPEPHGRLLKYDPSSDTTSLVLGGLAFANGVALSADQDYLVVCETWAYRCVKYWLEGEKKGETEIFVDKLPGRPDNINLAPDGSYWMALIQLEPIFPTLVYRSPAFRYLAETYPEIASEWVVNVVEQAMVVNVGSDGKIIRGFDDPTGEVMQFVTSALQVEDHLYFGSLVNNFIGKLPLAD